MNPGDPEGYADLHLHVLPGLDDGPREMAAALEMLRGLAAAGFRRLVATPHTDDNRYPTSPAQIAAAHAGLMAAARDAGIEIAVETGAEYAYGGRFQTDLQARRLLALGSGRHVLLELPEDFLPAAMPGVLFEVGAAGYYPILAHPERCQPFHDDLPRLMNLANGRALIQVSFRSLAGTFGRTIRRTAWALLEEGHADLVATDCHSPRELGKIVLPVLDALRDRLPARRVQQLLAGTPHRILTPT